MAYIIVRLVILHNSEYFYFWYFKYTLIFEDCSATAPSCVSCFVSCIYCLLCLCLLSCVLMANDKMGIRPETASECNACACVCVCVFGCWWFDPLSQVMLYNAVATILCLTAFVANAASVHPYGGYIHGYFGAAAVRHITPDAYTYRLLNCLSHCLTG